MQGVGPYALMTGSTTAMRRMILRCRSGETITSQYWLPSHNSVTCQRGLCEIVAHLA